MSDENFRTKLESLNFGSRSSQRSIVNADGTRTTEVRDEGDGGRVFARRTEHRSGRVDVQAIPKPATFGIEA